MLKTLELTNAEIYNYANSLLTVFNDENATLPIKVNFYINKNMTSLVELAKEVDDERIKIISKYGNIEEDGNTYHIDPENMPLAQRDLNVLFKLVQSVNIYTLTLEDFGDTVLTQGQMAAIVFMIDEKE